MIHSLPRVAPPHPHPGPYAPYAAHPGPYAPAPYPPYGYPPPPAPIHDSTVYRSPYEEPGLHELDDALRTQDRDLLVSEIAKTAM